MQKDNGIASEDVNQANIRFYCAFEKLLPTISATFNEPIDKSTISANTFIVKNSIADAVVTGNISLSEDCKTASLTPATSLSSKTTYSIILKSEIKDLAGNKLASEEKWIFTTA
jgi:hypothetical protein